MDLWRPDIICEVLQPYEDEVDQFFGAKAYRKFLIRDDGIQEVKSIKADPRFRGFYLTCCPNSSVTRLVSDSRSIVFLP
jgi:hypothetical protein